MRSGAAGPVDLVPVGANAGTRVAPEPEFHAVEDLLRRSAIEAEEQLETARTKAREAQRRVELLEPVVQNWHRLLTEYHESRASLRAS